MTSGGATARNGDLTIARARAIRAEYALAAARYANQVERARATARYAAVAQWTDEYRRSAASCRRLGKIIRSERKAA